MNRKFQIIFSIVAMIALILSGISVFSPRGEIIALSGDVAGETNFSQLGVGFDEEADYQITFYGNAQDYYVGLDDSVDDLILGFGSVMGTTPALGIDENLAVTTYGDFTFGGTTPVVTIGDGGEEDPTLVFDGNADDFYVAIDDTVDDLMIGYGSAVGTDQKLTFVDSATTTEIKVGDAAEFDIQFTFDGNAQDFHIGIDDTADDFIIGLGTALGTTPGLAIDENLAVTTYGDFIMGGTTPVLTIGDAGEEDAALVFDGNADDFYVAIDDTVDDLMIGYGAAVGTDARLSIVDHADTTNVVIGDAAEFDMQITFDGNAVDYHLGLDDTADDLILGYGATLETTERLTFFNDSYVIEIGDATESDMGFVIDGNAQDFYFALDDTADDFLIGLGNAVGTTPGLAIDENLAVTTYGDFAMTGTTPVLTIGDTDEEDAAIVFDGNAQDYHVGLDDTADDFIIGLGSALGTTPGLAIDENLAVTTYGDFTMGGTTPVLTVGDGGEEDVAIVFDGNADDFYVSVYDTADDFIIGHGSTIGTDARLSIVDHADTTAIVIGDAQEFDMQINFDGNAQDFHVGLDDTADDLVIGVGTALGTTPALTIDENAVTTFSGGSLLLFETVTAANVLDATECGKTMVIASSTEFETDLPAVSGNAGCFFRFVVGEAPSGASYTIVTNGSENVLYGITHEADIVAAGPVGAGVDTLTNTDGAGTVGDWIEFFCDGTYWFYVAWVDNGTGWEPSTAG